MPHDRATRRRRHRSGLRWTIGVNALLLGTVPLFPSAAPAGSIERFIQDFNRRLSSELGRLDPSDGERRLRFAQLLDEHVDLGAASALMLGPRWTRASAEDQARFRAALRDYLVGSFAARVHGFGQRRLRITELLWDGPVVTVVSELSSDHAVSIPLEWQITRGGPVGWRLFNVTVAGMSMAAIMRAQFSAAGESDGPGLAPLVNLLGNRPAASAGGPN